MSYKTNSFLASFFRKGIPEKNIMQLTRFVFAGGITASIDCLILFLGVEFFHINYLIAAAIGFIFGSSLNYLLSIKWVFNSGKFKNKIIEFNIFILFTFLGMGLNHLIMYLGVENLRVDYKGVKIISLVLVTLFNFLTKKFFVFKG